jgi:hypothetical protein
VCERQKERGGERVCVREREKERSVCVFVSGEREGEYVSKCVCGPLFPQNFVLFLPFPPRKGKEVNCFLWQKPNLLQFVRLANNQAEH